MNRRYCFEALDRTLKDKLGCNDTSSQGKPFGGLTVLLGGDFRQILLVINKGTKEDIVNATINRLDLWNYCTVFIEAEYACS